MVAAPLGTSPLLACVDQLQASLSDVRGAEPVFLQTREKADALRRLTALEARVAELKLRVMAAAGDVADSAGARDVGAWLAAETRQEFRTARADDRLAEALDRDCPKVAAGLRDGRVNLPQAKVIVTALDELPDDLDPQIRRKAEQALVGFAEQFAPPELRRLGRRILEIVAPEIAEAEEAKRLLAMEEHAHTKTKLVLRPLGDGTTRLSGLIPDAAAHRLITYLHAYTNPRRPDGTPPDPPATGAGGAGGAGSYPRRLGRAFCQLIEHVDPKRLPLHAGDATTLIVTMSLDQLRADLGVADLLNGERISAAEARRLACTATIAPAVLGGPSEILDLGRGERVFKGPLRKALLLRDKTCRAEGCDMPGTFTEAHHWDPWNDGGETTLANGILLCPFDHHRAHSPRWHPERLPNGDVRFHRRR